MENGHARARCAATCGAGAARTVCRLIAHRNITLPVLQARAPPVARGRVECGAPTQGAGQRAPRFSQLCEQRVRAGRCRAPSPWRAPARGKSRRGFVERIVLRITLALAPSTACGERERGDVRRPVAARGGSLLQARHWARAEFRFGVADAHEDRGRRTPHGCKALARQAARTLTSASGSSWNRFSFAHRRRQLGTNSGIHRR